MKEDILSQIANFKFQEVQASEARISQQSLIEKISALAEPRDFIAALKNKLKLNQPAVIAEIKKASPSQGVIREDFNPLQIAKIYEQSGAACLSILTDEKFFQGKPQYINEVKSQCYLPILRKDFIIDAYQIYESRVLGADCILLIAALLTAEQLIQFTALAHQLKMAVLVEVHDEVELKKALTVNTPLLGINNRDLRTFKTDLQITVSLSQQVPFDRIIITESGIYSAADVALMRSHQVNCFLVGESLMRASNIAEKFKDLFT